MKWVKSRSFYLGCFILSILAVGYVALWNHPYRKIAPFEHKWGHKKYSQFFEELYIRDFFKDKKNGYFVDIGANHYKNNSNTYYLEKHLNWQGIAVDPIASFAKGYKQHRPKTDYLSYFISEESGGVEKFYQVLSNYRLSSSQKGAVNRFPFKEIQVPTITMNDLLLKHQAQDIDFLSIDVELSEIEVLEGFDIEKYRPKLVCIETHGPIRAKIYEYFSLHNYMPIKKYSELDRLNTYFTPKS